MIFFVAPKSFRLLHRLCMNIEPFSVRYETNPEKKTNKIMALFGFERKNFTLTYPQRYCNISEFHWHCRAVRTLWHPYSIPYFAWTLCRLVWKTFWVYHSELRFAVSEKARDHLWNNDHLWRRFLRGDYHDSVWQLQGRHIRWSLWFELGGVEKSERISFFLGNQGNNVYIKGIINK